ncbi:MAG: alkene reductase [Deferrisomatales bacterium]
MLFAPFQLGPHRLRNRVVLAPMTCNRAGPGNVVQPMTATYYAQRASAGLLVTEATRVSETGVGYPNTPGIHTSEQVAGWRQVTEAVHAADGRIFLQLWHAGRISHPALQPGGALPVAPSAVAPAGEVMTYEGVKPFLTPRALETTEIPVVVECFARGAANARAAGFDGVEIHAANGYLIDQFLRDGTNRRTDAYGGSVANRARFLLEVTEAVCGAWEPGRVGVRLSPLNAFNSMADSDPAATFGYAAAALRSFGLAYLHVVEASVGPDGVVPQAFDYRALKSGFGSPYMANGAYTRARAEAVLAEERADFVSFGALFLANPDLPARLERNGPCNAPDPSTFYGGDERGYTDYPTLA